MVKIPEKSFAFICKDHYFTEWNRLLGQVLRFYIYIYIYILLLHSINFVGYCNVK